MLLWVRIHRFRLVIAERNPTSLGSSSRPSLPRSHTAGVVVVKKGGIGLDRFDSVMRRALTLCTILNGITQTVRALAELLRTLRGYG